MSRRGVRMGRPPADDRVLTTIMNDEKLSIDIHAATAADIEAIVALDAEITGTEKGVYWTEILERFTDENHGSRRYFQVAKSNQKQLLGFIVGEIRAWEFGSPPCGWVLALSVSPEQREKGIGSLLFDGLCAAMKKDGVTTIRTMVLGNDKVNLSFFRGEGLAAGPYIELERRLD